MAYLDKADNLEESYNLKLVDKLNNYRQEAVVKNDGKQISKKLLNSLNEARRTQRFLVGDVSIFLTPEAPEPGATNAQQKDEASTEDTLTNDSYQYINQLLDHSNDSEDFDVEASFEEVGQKMRDNTDNEQFIEQEGTN